jgi:hypothetical protein
MGGGDDQAAGQAGRKAKKAVASVWIEKACILTAQEVDASSIEGALRH